VPQTSQFRVASSAEDLHQYLSGYGGDRVQAIVDDVLQELGQTPKQLVDELEYDLVKLINKHSFMGVRTPSFQPSVTLQRCGPVGTVLYMCAPCSRASPML